MDPAHGPQATSRSVTQTHAANIKTELNSPKAAAGVIRDCVVGGKAASTFGYLDGSTHGYRVFVLYQDGVFETVLFGVGGVSDQAISDALDMLGSLVWTS
jgi:hypothetical protein